MGEEEGWSGGRRKIKMEQDLVAVIPTTRLCHGAVYKTRYSLVPRLPPGGILLLR